MQAKILIVCEFSGRVRDAFRKRGFNAISCDLKPSETSGPHEECDAIDFINRHSDALALIAFPPCTYLAISGYWRNEYDPTRRPKSEAALEFVRNILASKIPHKALENPASVISTQIRKRDQEIQPYEYGDDASKRTWLWLENLPKLTPTNPIAPRIVNGKPRWANQRDDGQHHLLNKDSHRQDDRSRTFPGIADAMAEQWGKHLTELYGNFVN